MRALWLVGMMGSGKTTVGEIIARRTGVEFIDTDSLIEAELDRPISSVWATEGEDAFRAVESERIRRVVAAGHDSVVATGGGVVIQPGNIELMRSSGTVVWLQADPDQLASRVAGSDDRPLLAGWSDEERLAALLADRAEAYAIAAHHRVETGSKQPEEIAREVMVLWNAS
jgi:shikimate kinase